MPEKLMAQCFTDSDHNIRRMERNEILYRQLTDEFFDRRRRGSTSRAGG